jgi:hypothetical protein
MRPKSDYAIKSIEMVKKALGNKDELLKIARKAKVSEDDLREEYELFLSIEELKDEIELVMDADEDVSEHYQELALLTKQLTDIQKRHG